MSIWVKCMYVYGVWMCVREFWSFHALYGAANALYWKCLKRQNSTYLTLLKHQNTKTSLYKLSKNHWVITLLESFGSVRRELQSTVSLDHPVVKGLATNRVDFSGDKADSEAEEGTGGEPSRVAQEASTPAWHMVSGLY